LFTLKENLLTREKILLHGFIRGKNGCTAIAAGAIEVGKTAVVDVYNGVKALIPLSTNRHKYNEVNMLRPERPLHFNSGAPTPGNGNADNVEYGNLRSDLIWPGLKS
jgi:hypothetical protein